MGSTEEVTPVIVVLQAELGKLARQKSQFRGISAALTTKRIAGVGRGRITGGVFQPQARIPTRFETIDDLGIESGVAQGFRRERNDSKRIRRGPKTAINRLRLPGHIRKALGRHRRLPLPEEVGAIDFGATVGTGAVRTKCAGQTRQQGRRVGKFERGGKAGHEEQVLGAAERTIHGGTAGKAIDPAGVRLARITETVRGAPLAVLHAKNGFRVERRGREPGKLSADAAQAVRTKGAVEDERLVDKYPRVGML